MNRSLPLLLLALVACGGDSPSPAVLPAAEPTSAPPTSAPPASAPPASPAPTATFVEPRYFRTPSDNIACEVSERAAVCDVRKPTWTPPPKPASCEFDWGLGVAVRAGAKAELTCHSDTAFYDKAPVLAYGERLSAYGFTCESRETGVRCTHVASGHGFLLSRGRYELK